MLLTFLSADEPLSKAYELDADGRLQKKSYPAVWQFTSHNEEVDGLKAFADACKTHARAGHCLLKGAVQRALVRESRAGSTDAHAATGWGCLDLDRYLATLVSAIAMLNAEGVEHVVQYSSAYGIETDRGLTCHLFFRFAADVSPSALKQWLMWKNLTTPGLVEHIQLTKTNTSLSWPLDVTTCQNDKLLYIAPPALKGIADPVGERIVHVPGEHPFLDLNFAAMPTAAQIKSMTETKVNELRAAKGLGARKFAYKIDKATGLEVLKGAEAATMTELKRERGFVYFNLNGGDSWAYWHPDERPEVIRNFKGEPDYLTSELLPDYWKTVEYTRKSDEIEAAVAKKAARAEIQGDVPSEPTDDHRVLVFRDYQTGLYYNGVFDGENLELAQAKSETQIQHYLKSKSLPEVDYIPIWNLIFDPHSDVRVDFSQRLVNTFTPTIYMKQSEMIAEPVFPTITKLLQHAVARDEKTLNHFFNWLACIWQFRDRTLAAWILHGIQGTGKGLLVHNVLKPLLGAVVVKRMEELEEHFNGYLETALLVVLDEAQVSDSKRSKMIMANIKNQITEPTITVRRMRTEARTVMNFTSWLILSNMPDPVTIDAADRRFNVGEFRREMLEITDAEIALLEAELPAFAAFLSAYPADRSLARTILASEERDRIIQTSRTSAELVAEALQKGMLEVFWEELPTGATDLLPVYQQALLVEYQELVRAAVIDGKTRFARDELRVLFEYLCGDMPRTPYKFTQLLRHRNIHLKNMRLAPGASPVVGFEVTWRVDDDWLAARRAELALPKFKEKVA